MKVLHIWNTAGVASLMSKSLRKHGIQSDVIMRTGYDPFNMCEYYGDELLNVGGSEFLREAIKKAEGYDIIHVHGIFKMMKRLRDAYPDKKLILQHHGTELTTGDIHELFNYYQYCDSIVTSTHDLFMFLNKFKIENTLIENAVDTDLFKPIEQSKFKDALMFDIRYVDTESSQRFVEKVSDWEYNLIDRETNHVSYTEMPLFLNKYSRFIDVKCYEWTNGIPGQAYSKTGREALACGLEVLNYRGKVVKGLPIKFTPEHQVNELINLYNK